MENVKNTNVMVISIHLSVTFSMCSFCIFYGFNNFDKSKIEETRFIRPSVKIIFDTCIDTSNKKYYDNWTYNID